MTPEEIATHIEVISARPDIVAPSLERTGLISTAARLAVGLDPSSDLADIYHRNDVADVLTIISGVRDAVNQHLVESKEPML